MKTYTVTAEKLHNAEWKTARVNVRGYRAALNVAKAFYAANLGAVLLRDDTTGRARFVES